jgi:hypothetical protein
MATHQDLVDATCVVEHTFHLRPRLHPFIGGVEFAPQAIGRAVQIGERIFQIVFRVARLSLL